MIFIVFEDICMFIYMYVHMYMYVWAHTCHLTWVAVRGQLTIICLLLSPCGYQDQTQRIVLDSKHLCY